MPLSSPMELVGADSGDVEVLGKKRKRRSHSPSAGREAGGDAEPNETKIAKFSGGGSAWDHLDLVLSLQGKAVPIQRKIELAFDFVSTKADRSWHDGTVDNIWIFRLVSFLGNWAQPILISSENSKTSSELFDPGLDYRCWAILRFCIKKKPTISISPNLLKALSRVGRHALLRVDGGGLLDMEESLGLFEQVLDCISLLFSSNSRAFFNAGVDLWVSCAIEVVTLAHKVSSDEMKGCYNDSILSRLVLCLLEQFANFLRFYANPKNIFRVFVDRLLDLLLELLVLLHSQSNARRGEQVGSLLKIVEDILSNGLFHPAHISGYFSLKNLNKKSDAKEVKGSYHRHLFERFIGIKAENKAVLLAGFGYLLRLFVNRVRNRRGSLASKEAAYQAMEKSNEAIEESHGSKKPLFEVFVLFMEPLMLEYKAYSQKCFSNLGVTRLVEAHCMLKSMNEILMSLIQERIYVPTEDTPEGSYFKFLQEIYDMIISIAGEIYQFWVSTVRAEDATIKKMLPLIAREVLVAVRHFLEIEYKVIGDELVKLWLMTFAFSAINASLEDIKPCSLLAAEIVNLASQVICVFSELRQVTHSIFTLCKAVRTFRIGGNADAVRCPFSVDALSSQKCLGSLVTLLRSQSLRLDISSSIKSMPERQASGCIEELKADLTDTLKWIKDSSFKHDTLGSQEKSSSIANMSDFDLQAELLGRLLSELYTTVLDSIVITASNSVLVGNSVKKLMESFRPIFGHLVQNEPNNLDKLIFNLTGKHISKNIVKQHGDGQQTIYLSLSWAFVFFFRLYVSCRSLYRQSISLMPPDLAIEASELMGNLFIVCCGKEWTNTANILAEGYFSWVTENSSSLLDVIEFLSGTISMRSYSGSASLVYVLHIMALQRLNDLNRQIKAFEFLVEDDLRQFQVQNQGNPELLKEACSLEAAGLTNFMMGYMRLLSSEQKNSVQTGTIVYTSHSFLINNDAWDLSLCSLDEDLLLLATWWLLCQNIDIWSSHASKKDLKEFFSILIHFSLVHKGRRKDAEQNVTSQSLHKKVTMHNISLELLCDSVLYDQKVLSKNWASSLCHALKKSLSPFVKHTHAANALLNSLPDWSEILNKLDNGQLVDSDGNATYVSSPLKEADLVSCNVDETRNSENELMFSDRTKLRSCENLLNLLSTTPGVHANAKSFLRSATYILHLERLLLSKLLSSHSGSSSSNPIELVHLFLSCRRALKYLVMAFDGGCIDLKRYSVFSEIFGTSYSQIWLLRSVLELVKSSNALFGELSDQVKCMIFSLVDHTSQIFFTLGNTNSALALSNDKHIELSLNDGPNESENTEEDGQTSDTSEIAALEHVKITAEMLENQTRRVPVTVKDSMHAIKLEACFDILCWDEILCTVSGVQGFLWGLVAALESRYKDYSTASSQERNSMLQYASRFSRHIVMFETYVDLCLYMLLVDSECGTVALDSAHPPPELDCDGGFLNLDTLTSGFGKRCNYEANHHTEIQVQDSRCSTLNCSVDALHSNGTSNMFSEMHDIDLSKLQHLKGCLLENLLKGQSPLIAFALRQLFGASAAILKLKCMLSFPSNLCMQMCSYFQKFSSHILVGTSYMVLNKMADLCGCPDTFAFVWIDGILRYLEVIGSYFTLANSNFSKELYAQVINAHLRVIGKCISLQGKSATLSTHDIGSSTKTLNLQKVTGDEVRQDTVDRQCWLNSFKSRLRMSLRNFIGGPSNLHLNTALQVIERALIGVHQHCHSIYEVNTGSIDGGKVSSAVAAGIDCLYLVLESVSGNKHVLKKNIPDLVGALFNIVLHLQNSFIFYSKKLPHDDIEFHPDAGAIVLMCVEVITTVAGKHSFQMDACYVSQCLHLPMALFKDFKHLASCRSHSFVNHCSQGVGPSADACEYIIDRRFLVDMYAACCKLLCATLRHRPCEVGRCVAVLEDSVTTLLGCLESQDSKLAGVKGYFAWDLEEAIKCASFFRRIYEEIRQQRDVLARHSMYFLSSYITILAGYGPFQTGIRREIDEALRPGVYSLIDICEESDFQRLHTFLGEGPCRSSLANLVHDYKLQFQYKGKI